MSLVATYEAPGAMRFRLANEVAKRHGLECVQAHEGQLSDYPSEGETTCEECSFEIPEGREVWMRRVSYEYDEWESYCSQACASRLGHCGNRADFLERMGWMLTPNSMESIEWVWAYVPDTDSFRKEGHEGDARWQVDVERADQLAAEVDSLSAE